MEDDEINKFIEKIYSSINTRNKEEVLIDIISKTDLDKRIEICNAYMKKYDHDLYADLKSKLSGNFKELVIHLFLPPDEFMAKMLKKSLKGFSIDESLIYEIFTICTQEELKLVETAFKKETGKDLIKEIEINFPLAIRKNLINLLNIPRNNYDPSNNSQCEKWAQNLIDSGENNWVSNEEIFKKIFISKSGEELALIGRIYYKKTGVNIMNTIEKRLKNKVRNLLRELMYNVIMPEELFADKIYNALHSSNISLLNRILVARNQIDLKDIKDIYKKKYNNELKDDIKTKTTGAHQKVCLILIN